MKKVIALLSIFLTFTIFVSPVSSKTEAELEKEISELEAKLKETQTKANTLKSQIAYYDGQIQLTTLKIIQTEELIASLTSKIVTLEESLEKRSKVLEKQVVTSYKSGAPSPLPLLLSSSDFSHAISKFKYMQIIQSNNRKFIYDTQKTQSNYSDQKDLITASRKKLETQKVSLNNIRAERDTLLKHTKNDEETYQHQLEQARLEMQALESAIALGKLEGPVKKGDPIALFGNSGSPYCSTGAHLHFEVRVNDKWVNAETYLRPMTDKWGLNIGSGSWDWPLKGDIEITQRYGKTPYSYRYVSSGGQHTGIDMVSNLKTIYSPVDGTLYSYVGKCGSANLNIKYVDHGNGIKTFYLHVQ